MKHDLLQVPGQDSEMFSIISNVREGTRSAATPIQINMVGSLLAAGPAPNQLVLVNE